MNPDDPDAVLDRLGRCSTDDPRLVSVYVPPERLVDEVIVFLGDEHAEAGELSEERRQHVEGALVRLQDRLTEYDTPPENGMALFCGRVDDEWIEATLESPPRSVGTFRYSCEEIFLTEAYRELLAG
ncbi:hypothetical protein [Halalkalicoccus tibetensis]|uniref:eRF1/Pelota-like N-terminal domain-containing protein n=1 Tax=Halalkalicoccus tibetensis TaxID=175632 RepID=A0ABD5V280_9EURY